MVSWILAKSQVSSFGCPEDVGRGWAWGRPGTAPSMDKLHFSTSTCFGLVWFFLTWLGTVRVWFVQDVGTANVLVFELPCVFPFAAHRI